VAAGVAVGTAVGAVVVTGVGMGVGAGVGGDVGTGVGAGVGAGVGVGPTTTTVPVMNGWISQWYANDPAARMVIVREPLTKTPVSQVPLFAVEVCETLSLFVQVTVSPTLTVTLLGTNEKFLIDTAALAAAALVASTKASESSEKAAAITRPLLE
jgi:hypothetical protein